MAYRRINIVAALIAVMLPNLAVSAVSIEKQVDAVIDDVISWRRDFHQHAELSNREFRTAKVIAAHLRELDLDVKTNVAKTGVVGVLRGGLPGPVLALRADMDGLPVVEKTGLPYASTQRSEYEGREVGVMHACGHDNHMAILMGAAEILAGMREQLPGTIKFIFQPAEEGAPKGEEGGAKLMIAEGVLENPSVDAIIGLHISQGSEVGTASYRSLGFMASAQRFDIHIQGKQTHGARPWAGVDPIVVGAQIINGLQTIVSRQIDITQHPAVVTVGSFAAGVRNNIVPESAKLTGTIRTFDANVRNSIHKKIRAIAEQTAISMGAVATVEIDPGVPVTFNDANLTEQMVPTLERVYGERAVFESPRVTGAEDFSFFQEQVPGFFFFIGARPPELSQAQAIPNHSPFFYVDEDALAPAVQAMTELAVDYLNSAGAGR
ncbi:MAG: amidohydrolase [Pseudomonadales bacterium]